MFHGCPIVPHKCQRLARAVGCVDQRRFVCIGYLAQPRGVQDAPHGDVTHAFRVRRSSYYRILVHLHMIFFPSPCLWRLHTLSPHSRIQRGSCRGPKTPSHMPQTFTTLTTTHHRPTLTTENSFNTLYFGKLGASNQKPPRPPRQLSCH